VAFVRVDESIALFEVRQCAVFLRSRAEVEHAGGTARWKVEKSRTQHDRVAGKSLLPLLVLDRVEDPARHLASDTARVNRVSRTGLLPCRQETEFAELRRLLTVRGWQPIDKR